MLKTYIFLVISIVFEILGTSFLQSSQQFSRLWPTIGMLICYIISFWVFSYTLKVMPLGIAYAIWGAVGIVLVATVGFVWFGQKIDLAGGIGIGLIVAGVLVVNIFSKTVGH